MKCGRCGAEIMLGSAACARCGWSPYGAEAVVPHDLAGPARLSLEGQARESLEGQARQSLEGQARQSLEGQGRSYSPTDFSASRPPPPPAPNWSPPMGMPRPVATGPTPTSGGSSAAGCLGFIVLVSIAMLGAGLFAAARGGDVVDDVRDAIDRPQGFDAPRVAGPPVAPGDVAGVHSLDDLRVAEHAIDATGTVAINVFGFDDFDPRIQVVDADGDILGEDDDGGSGRDSLLTVDIDEPGAVLLVREFGMEAGGYSVLVVEGPADGSDDGSPVVGLPLAVDEPIGGVLAQGGAATHGFVGTGVEVTISVEAVTTLDPIVTVFGAGGEQLARNDDFDSAVNRDARVQLLLAAGQEITVEVTGFGSTDGPYFVTVEPVE